jgi:hypothetical protein
VRQVEQNGVDVPGSFSDVMNMSRGSYYLFTYTAPVEPSPLLLWQIIGLVCQPWMIDGDDCGAISGMNKWQGKQKYWDKTCPSAALSTRDLT